MSISRSSKLQIFEPPVKMARKSLCVNLLTQFAQDLAKNLFKKVFALLFPQKSSNSKQTNFFALAFSRKRTISTNQL